MNILQKIKKVCDTLECQPIYDSLIEKMQRTERKSTVVGVLGTANSGKSSIINAIAGTALPTNPISSMEGYFVDSVKSTESTIVSTNEWMKQNNISFVEKVERIFSNETEDIEYCTYFSNMDICLYIIDAQMAYTRNDALLIEHLCKFGIPTIICVSKYEKLTDDAKKEVISYLTDKLPKSDIVSVVENNNFTSLVENAKEVTTKIEECNNAEYIKSVRNSFISFFIVDAVSHLYEDCKSKLDKCIEGEQRAETMTAEKMNKISALESEWMRIELALSTRRQNTEEKLRSRLSTRKADMLRRLSHEIEVCSDVKHYWDKELSYRIDDMMRAELQSYTQIMNTDIVNTLRWLQEEILKSFKRQSGFVPSITCTIDNKETTLDTIEISDNKKLKIVTRVGTAATVIAAGTLLATSGVAGVVMAISMLSGIGAEWIMGRKTKESRTKVLEVLPSILDKCELVYINQISESLKSSYEEILGNLKTSQADWKAKSIATIEEERLIAIHNCGRDKYNKCMDEINEISASLLN